MTARELPMKSMGPRDCRSKTGSQQRMEILDMSILKRSLLSLGGLLLMLAVVVILISSQAVAAPGEASGALLQSPGGMAVTALPLDTCTLVDTTRTCVHYFS